MVSDGHRLRQSWSTALNDALTSFRGHLTSAQSPSWKRVPVPTRENSAPRKGKARASAHPEHSDVVVHRKSTKSGEIYRVVVEVAVGDEPVDLEAWKAVLVTPELRQEWDPAVEASQLVEMFDLATRIVRTKFTLGWPANPRDAVMVSRTFSDATTVIDISTSLPRSPDEPAYLRPSPPYVRSHVDLFAWCIQLISPPAQSSPPGEVPQRKTSETSKVRITCFWQHDLRAVWNFNTSSSLAQQLPSMTLGLLASVKKRGSRVTVLTGYGHGVSIERAAFDVGREALTVDYSIIPEDQESMVQHGEALHGLDELYTVKEQRRLERSIECVLPSSEGWDIRISTRASSEKLAHLPWSAHAYRIPPSSQDTLKDLTKVSFQVKHAPLIDDHSILKVKIIIELSGALKGIRLNGVAHPVEERQVRDPLAFSMSNQLIQDASSAVDLSFHTASTVTTVDSDASSSATPRKPLLTRTNSMVERSPAADKSILARVRRNYIYFSSLLQEPEAKWKRNTETRGVSVTQLDSIDPTLVVYRAEATFVGVGLWDLYSAVVTPGARVYWDKQYEDAVLVEDVNELTELWHYKTKPAWPVVGRDAVLLKTVYKSPTTVHVFSFSADETHLFANVPVSDPNVIRTQVDLQGWAIEALSPTTTLITLLEQSDPKGWSGKSTIPQQMIANVAGVGEFAIKCGGPPVVTRLSGAKANNIRYEHERGIFRIEYVGSESRKVSALDSAEVSNDKRPTTVDNSSDVAASEPVSPSRFSAPVIECELRCDIDTWSTSLDIVIDPPPQSISCLRRHRLSAGGGGLWLTFGHDAIFTADERLLAIVRRAPLTFSKEKGVVMVNGRKVNVDIEDLPESEVKSLTKQKRVKPVRIPLDQPPVLGVIRRRRAEWSAENGENGDISDPESPTSPKATTSMWKTSTPKFPSPLANFFTMAIEQATSTTQQAVAALSPPVTVPGGDTSFPISKPPMQYALEALSFAQEYQRGTYRDNWSQVTDKGMLVHRRPSPEVSPMIPVHRGEKVIESVTADEVASAIANYDCRKRWDDRFDSATIFEEFGADCHTTFLVSKGGFPFRDRGFYLASLTARDSNTSTLDTSRPNTAQSPVGNNTVIYCVAASFNPDSVVAFAPSKYNSYALPIGRVFLDAWILETLDPYTAENYAIPSTRCTRLVAVDYAGSVPVTYNSMINSALPKSIIALDTYMKAFSPLPTMKLPTSGLLATRRESDNIKNDAWELQTSDPQRTLLSTRYTLESNTFRGNVLVSFVDLPEASLTERVDNSTPKANKVALISPSGSPETMRPGRVNSNPPSPTVTLRHRRTSSTVTPSGSLAMRSRSRDAVRMTPSIFSLAKEFKAQGPVDFVAAEIVIDLKLYPDGYEVWVASHIEAGDASAKPMALFSVTVDSKFTSPTTHNALPLSHAVYPIPSSPLHADGLNVKRPSRHLLRLTLPTAQYLMPTIDDPLTGETRSAPPKPAWFKDLEDKDKSAVVNIEIRPSKNPATKHGKKVMINDLAVSVDSEKDSPKGSHAHLEDMVGKMNILSRVSREDGNELPRRLIAPLAVAYHLYDLGSLPSITPATSIDELAGSDSRLEDIDNDSINASPKDIMPIQEKPSPPSTGEKSHGFLGFLNSYNTSLLRFTNNSASATRLSDKLNSRAASITTPTPGSSTEDLLARASPPTDCALSPSIIRTATDSRYSLSTLVFVALIAFLIGSLLRSLLSPADFIYVVSDMKDAPERGPGGLDAMESGWREIKRLLEVKYIVGGWDFQVAVVRRH